MKSMSKSRRGIQCKDFKFDLTSVDGNGVFEGYGSIFGNVDAYNEVVEPGAFAKSIQSIKASGRPLPALWNHNANEPIGLYDEISEDSTGLRVKGRLLIGSVPKAKEVNALVEAGVVSGLSIGYFVKESHHNSKNKTVHLEELELREISVVTFPANGDARIETIKMKLATGGLPTKREFELILRESGFSKGQALQIATSGYGDFVDTEGVSAASNAEIYVPSDSVIAQLQAHFENSLN